MPWDEATSGADPAQSAGGASDEFDDWFDEELAPEQTKPAQPAPPMPLSMAGETGADDEEDDDLEMFRSWLQSLKK